MNLFSTTLAIAILVTSTASFGAAIHDDIYRKALTIQSEIYNSRANLNDLTQATNHLSEAMYLIRSQGGGGGTGNNNLYCQRIGTTSSYAPTRITDQQWLQEYGTDLNQCQAQIIGSKYDLFCSRVQATSYYAPRMISTTAWRGQYGSDFATCDRQVRGAQPAIFCQRIQSTQYFAPARIYDGSWLANNGSLLPDCLRSIGSIRSNAAVFNTEPAIPNDNKIN